jgi:hypothetical protein
MLVRSGTLMGVAGTPVQVRNHEGKNVSTEHGPYMASQLPVAGFAVIEAPSMERLLSQPALAADEGAGEANARGARQSPPSRLKARFG